VVIAIIGVLAAIAISYPREDRATTRGFAEQVVGELDVARMRAISSRRWHRVTVSGTQATIEAGDTVGMAMPTSWSLVGSFQAPNRTRIVAMATVTDIQDGGTDPDDGDGFDEVLLFAPDGSSVARTLYLSDPYDRAHYRVVVYRATGTARVFDGW